MSYSNTKYRDSMSRNLSQESPLKQNAEAESAHTSEPAVDGTLLSIVQGTASERGEHFFESLVQYLAVSLNVKAAFVAEFNAERTAVHTLAVWVGGQLEENFVFELEGTPCQHVLSGGIQHFSDNIRELFPKNNLLKSLNARSYLAIPLTDDAGVVVGHLAVIDDHSMEADERELSIFHIFAARATAELIRRQAEQQLDDSLRREHRLRDERQRIEAEVAYLREELRSRSEFAEIVGESDGIWKVLRNIDMVAPTDSTVLILGETGTGKELVARAIHKNSKRHNGSFVRVNCAALPESLLESELFGHEHGAFTGATQQRTGRFELADGGTIFLDEIGEMPLPAQSRLLRVLQEQELERVGSSQTIRIDVRVLAATNRNLLDMVEEGTFREDLYYRLNVFPVPIPPLRERLEDIPTLVRFFLTKLGSRLGKKIDQVPKSVFSMLRDYAWPGNIRELENIIERAMILTPGDTLLLPAGVIPVRRKKEQRSTQLLPLEEIERNHIQTVLNHTQGTIAGPKGAAKILGLNPNTLRSRMEKLGITVERSNGN
ncbi:sigma 54-interacting transcriptional regulator [Gimesia aquarii]|uniref:Formate hydrogenlyase transcriptional activator n=1 Tax=Gimesia aquarii TaxID=2527964 RepID=A0A517VU20_9PLAN|nr:sigma 54-interacting transcriptional regulator [Gimesia aquarii]QDT96504.1 Formate hydrogenlyase transcriptional activator [Gimesia aquarii]